MIVKIKYENNYRLIKENKKLMNLEIIDPKSTFDSFDDLNEFLDNVEIKGQGKIYVTHTYPKEPSRNIKEHLTVFYPGDK